MKTIKFIFVAIVSAIVAMFAGIVVLAVWDNERAFIWTLFGGAILCAMILGAFDEPIKAKFDSIKHRMGIRKAA